ncbi:MAG: hypothetical protein R2795_08025 [Saprospiraceae bacterium]
MKQHLHNNNNWANRIKDWEDTPHTEAWDKPSARLWSRIEEDLPRKRNKKVVWIGWLFGVAAAVTVLFFYHEWYYHPMTIPASVVPSVPNVVHIDTITQPKTSHQQQQAHWQPTKPTSAVLLSQGETTHQNDVTLLVTQPPVRSEGNADNVVEDIVAVAVSSDTLVASVYEQLPINNTSAHAPSDFVSILEVTPLLSILHFNPVLSQEQSVMSVVSTPPTLGTKWRISATIGGVAGVVNQPDFLLPGRSSALSSQQGWGALVRISPAARWSWQVGMLHQTFSGTHQGRFIRFIDFNQEQQQGGVFTSSLNLNTALVASSDETETIEVERDDTGIWPSDNRVVLSIKDKLELKHTSLPLMAGFRLFALHPFSVEVLAGVQYHQYRFEVIRSGVEVMNPHFRLRPQTNRPMRSIEGTMSSINLLAGLEASVQITPKWQAVVQGQWQPMPDTFLAQMATTSPQLLAGIRYNW